ncbi:probable RNA-dependent RNA polymerase 5 isoform X2 [Mangifera indica]|uniref:probable RNA-dependent RNA polymerase 5 isoform X2 n=1 Tax=Mangifera indica TaxID=29780 RepID=UPI001CFB554C|nr:probable RNA-dependent RNA polymerase 5 isoform X2 [Mangifera indica]
MSDSISLPHSVQQLINEICTNQNQRSPDAEARQALASVGEEEALNVLRVIKGKTIHSSFSGFIKYLINQRHNSTHESPQKRPCLSPSHSHDGSPVNIVRPMNLSQVLNDGMSRSPVPEPPRGSPLTSSTSSRMESNRISIPQYVALGELEFRKAFLILSYIGKKKLEDAMSADKIRELKDLSMVNLESKLWSTFGNDMDSKDRRMSIDWDSGKTHIYRCHVSADGSYTFKGPYLDQTKTHLQRVLGDDNVLMVNFEADETCNRNFGDSSTGHYDKYRKIGREGILLGLRCYRFFVFKDGGKKEKKKEPTLSSVKCYFVCLESDAIIDNSQHYILSGKTVNEARALFMHVHTVSNVANYMSRLSLILSKTMKLELDFTKVTIEKIEDIPCYDKDGNPVYKDGKLLIHTDGTGFISEDLALKCPNNVFKGKCRNDDSERFAIRKEIEGKLCEGDQPESHSGVPPLLMQVRLFHKGCAVKGTLLVNKKLPSQTIQIRPSMIKVEADPNLSGNQTINSLEVVSTSQISGKQSKQTTLSKNLIALLNFGGVPESFFLDIVRNALEDVQGVFSNKRNALKVSLRYGGMDDEFISARMILSGIFIDEPYLKWRLSTFFKEEKKSLQDGKLPVTDSYYLMGTVDPTGILERNEVCIILNDGQVSWEKVLVYRNPGLHFGDIHVLKAKYVKELDDVVGNAKYAIFFPCKGPRSLGDEIAKGDFDGDMYFVSRNPELLKHFRASEPWTSNPSTNNMSTKRPSDLSPEELEDELFKLFLTTRFQPSYAMGQAADSWRAIMDRLLTLGDESAAEKALMKKNIYQLIDVYYEALDAPKKNGRKIEVPEELKAERFPCHMGKDASVSFKSKSVLGKICNTVKEYKGQEVSVENVWKLPYFNDDEVPDECKIKWKGLYDQYRKDMSLALENGGEGKDEAANEVIKKYKQILYEAAEFEQSRRNIQEIYDEALVIYNLAYDYAKRLGAVSRCGFAWKVAGSALCKFYAMKQGERTLLCLPSVLQEICG